jgi:hypothetical protein
VTDLEISKALALAIGWREFDLAVSEAGRLFAYRHGWHKFDYRDWNVIGPIAERYSVFPQSRSTGNFKKAKAQGYTDVESWEVFYYDYNSSGYMSGNWKHVVDKCPKRCIAMAVIGAKK